MPPAGDSGMSHDELIRHLMARWPESRIEPTLDRMRGLTELLGDPQHAYPVIHVTGTNGKTSTARMIESLLRAHGLRTGLFTSPHLLDPRERICFDGEPISQERFARAWEDIKPYVEIVDARSIGAGGPALSFFEVMVGLAFSAFADAPVDVAVIEVGMGGAWDATNVADGKVAVITPIGMDHADYLGDTIEQIAAEKAGIIKEGSRVVLATQELPVAEVLLTRTVERDATVARESLEFGVAARDIAIGGQMLALQGLHDLYPEVFIPLFGEHQAQNAAVALAAVEAFMAGPDGLDVETVREGFMRASSPGRLEIVRRSPTIIVDAAHNPHGARALAGALTDSFDFATLVGVVGVLGDKDALGILVALESVLDSIVVTAPASPRAMPVEDLAVLAADVFGEERVWVEHALPDALDRAVTLAEEVNDYGGAGVLVSGSVVLVGEAKRLLSRQR